MHLILSFYFHNRNAYLKKKKYKYKKQVFLMYKNFRICIKSVCE